MEGSAQPPAPTSPGDRRLTSAVVRGWNQVAIEPPTVDCVPSRSGRTPREEVGRIAPAGLQSDSSDSSDSSLVSSVERRRARPLAAPCVARRCSGDLAPPGTGRGALATGRASEESVLDGLRAGHARPTLSLDAIEVGATPGGVPCALRRHRRARGGCRPVPPRRLDDHSIDPQHIVDPCMEIAAR